MTTSNELRLLPWSDPDGKPCYLSTDDRGGYLSRLADDIERAQLVAAAELLHQIPEALDVRDADAEDMRRLAKELTAVLGEVLRVATSRGHLLALTETRCI